MPSSSNPKKRALLATDGDRLLAEHAAVFLQSGQAVQAGNFTLPSSFPFPREALQAAGARLAQATLAAIARVAVDDAQARRNRPGPPTRADEVRAERDAMSPQELASFKTDTALFHELYKRIKKKTGNPRGLSPDAMRRALKR